MGRDVGYGRRGAIIKRGVALGMSTVVVFGAGCDVRTTSVGIVLDCGPDPAHIVPGAQQRTDPVRTNIYPSPVLPGGTLYVDIDLDAFADTTRYPDDRVVIYFAIPDRGIRLQSWRVEQPDQWPGWSLSIGDTTAEALILHFEPVPGALINKPGAPRVHLIAVVDAAAGTTVSWPTLSRTYLIGTRGVGSFEQSCRPHDPRQTIGSFTVAPR